MSARDLIYNFITETFLSRNPSQDFSDDTSLIESGIIDSLGIIKTLDFIERQFGFKVPEQDVIPEYFDNIRTIASYVEQHLADEKRN